jgi:putative membrane protein
MDFAELIPLMPPFQAVMNALATVLLSVGYYFIRSGNRSLHRICMSVTLVISSVFLVSYVSYHALVGYQPFAGEGLIRPVYFTLLGSHIVLAAVIVPLVLLTLWFALRGNFERHPLIARWTLPVWLYVSVSGVVIYLLGFHLYLPASL